MTPRVHGGYSKIPPPSSRDKKSKLNVIIYYNTIVPTICLQISLCSCKITVYRGRWCNQLPQTILGSYSVNCPLPWAPRDKQAAHVSYYILKLVVTNILQNKVIRGAKTSSEKYCRKAVLRGSCFWFFFFLASAFGIEKSTDSWSLLGKHNAMRFIEGVHCF